MAKVKKEVELTSEEKEIEDAEAADAEAQAEAVADGAEAGAEASEEAAAEIPATVEVKTREGFKIVGRKPVFADRRFIFMQPEGMKLPGNEVLAAACIESIEKLKKDAKGKPMRDAEGQEIYEPIELQSNVHPWFYLGEMGLEGPTVYVMLWTDTYMPNNEEMAQGLMYAMAELAKGNA